MRSAAYTLLALLLLVGGQVEAQELTPGTSTPAQAPATQSPPDAEPEAVEPPAAGASAAAAVEPTLPQAATDISAAQVELGPPTAEEAALAELTPAELAALGIEEGVEGGLDTDLHFGGFMDVNYTHLLNPDDAPLAVPADGAEASFFVGNINVYVTKNLLETFRMMAEVRFVYAPNGSVPVNPGTTPSYTETLDYSSSSLRFRWGGISIERAYGEWSPLSFLSLRVGSFLTPYGIWNVDHGSPVFIPVGRPFAVGGNFFPERQTGLELFGGVGLATALTLRYHLTLSNGLGPVSEYRDLDSNKAIGGRLAIEHVGLGTLQVGGSAFYGKNSAVIHGIGLNADGTALTVTKEVSEAADVTSVASDVLWKYKSVHLQAEWVGQRWIHADAGRTRLLTAGQIGVPSDAMPPDAFNWGGYVLAGYRLPWWGVMPYMTIEYARTNNFGILSKTTFSQAGLNIRPVDDIVLKIQYQFTFSGSPGTEAKAFSSQLAWAF